MMKKKKRIIALVMAALLATSAVGASVAFIPSNTGIVAEAATENDWEYELLDGCFAVITEYNGTDTEITIPSKLGGYTVAAIGDEAFAGNSKITNVVIPDSVTNIYNDAFYNCTGLKGISIGSGVKSIGYGAFSGCAGLGSITIPNSVTDIGSNAFYGCTGLTSVVIPGSAKKIGHYAFFGCNGLTSITISEGVEDIGIAAFYNCPKLKSVNIPSSVKKIYTNAFGYYNSTSGNKEKVKSFTIYCSENSAALTYARNNGFNYAVPKVTVSSALNTATGIQIKWNELEGAQGYKLYRKTGNGKWAVIATVGAGTTSYNDTRAVNGYRYTYAVRAFNNNVLSTYTAKTCTRVTRPAIISTANTAAGRLTVKWYKNDKATGYVVMYQTGTAKKYAHVKGSTSFYKHINGLTKGKTYNVYVRSYKTVGGVNYYSAWSPCKTVKITK